MDIEGWYSVTPENIAAQIAERCRCGVVVDAFCGVGGNAIQFAFTCEKVIAIDNSLTRLACAKHNAKVYGVDDRITFILGDFVTWSKEYVKQKSEGKINKDEEVEVVFLSPPWGGIDYQKAGSSPSSAKRPKTTSHQIPDTPTPATSSTSSEFYPLSALAPLHGKELFKLARDMTPHVAYYLPRNVDVGQLARLPLHAPRSDKGKGGGKGTVPERIEIEEEWMGTKMKAVTVYFGDLTKGAVAQDSEPGEGEGAVEGNDR
ncbi:S-adenosyl-L-methionine-dependent methyltransferase [Meredithblackwellia eburnea MCA 4105]